MKLCVWMNNKSHSVDQNWPSSPSTVQNYATGQNSERELDIVQYNIAILSFLFRFTHLFIYLYLAVSYIQQKEHHIYCTGLLLSTLQVTKCRGIHHVKSAEEKFKCNIQNLNIKCTHCKSGWIMKLMFKKTLLITQHKIAQDSLYRFC